MERQDATGAPVGEWTVGDGNLAPKLGNMRHFAVRAGGRYHYEQFESVPADSPEAPTWRGQLTENTVPSGALPTRPAQLAEAQGPPQQAWC